MNLLIEASAPGLPGLPVAASPGESSADGSPFGDLLNALLALGPGQPAEGTPADIAAAIPTEEEDAPIGDEAFEDSAGQAIGAALALLSLGLAPVAPAPTDATPSEASVETTEGALAMAPVAPAPTQPAPVAARPLEPVAGAEVPSEAVQADTPAAEPVEAEAPEGEPPGLAPPGPVAEPPPATLQGVVRIAGNAEAIEPGDHDRAPASRPADQQLSAMTAVAATPPSAGAPVAPVDAPAAPAAPQPLPPAAQVAQAVIERVVEGGGEVRLRLDPPDLGEIVIRISVHGDHVRVDVHTGNAEAARLLRDATPNLSTLLGDRGLGLADVSVGHGGRDRHQPGFGEESFNQSGGRDDGSFAALMGIDTSAENRQHNRIRATYNPDGAFLYRI